MSYYYPKRIAFSELLFKVFTRIEGMHPGSEEVTFYCEDGSEYKMYHQQSCCEHVSLEDVIGEVDNLIGHRIIQADEATSDKNPQGKRKEHQDSFTWTFYNISTVQGTVTLRWYGSSNGYYSESVDVFQFKPAR